MTELKPLGYVASLVVFALIVAFVATMQWNPVLRAKVVMLPWILAWTGAWALGKMLGVSAWIGRHLTHWAYALVELWAANSRVAKTLYVWNDRLFEYSVKGPLYRPQHAA